MLDIGGDFQYEPPEQDRRLDDDDPPRSQRGSDHVGDLLPDRRLVRIAPISASSRDCVSMTSERADRSATLCSACCNSLSSDLMSTSYVAPDSASAGVRRAALSGEATDGYGLVIEIGRGDLPSDDVRHCCAGVDWARAFSVSNPALHHGALWPPHARRLGPLASPDRAGWIAMELVSLLVFGSLFSERVRSTKTAPMWGVLRRSGWRTIRTAA